MKQTETKRVTFIIDRYKAGKVRVRIGSSVGRWHTGNGGHREKIACPVGTKNTPVIETDPDFAGDIT